MTGCVTNAETLDVGVRAAEHKFSQLWQKQKKVKKTLEHQVNNALSKELAKSLLQTIPPPLQVHFSPSTNAEMRPSLRPPPNPHVSKRDFCHAVCS